MDKKKRKDGIATVGNGPVNNGQVREKLLAKLKGIICPPWPRCADIEVMGLNEKNDVDGGDYEGSVCQDDEEVDENLWDVGLHHWLSKNQLEEDLSGIAEVCFPLSWGRFRWPHETISNSVIQYFKCVIKKYNTSTYLHRYPTFYCLKQLNWKIIWVIAKMWIHFPSKLSPISVMKPAFGHSPRLVQDCHLGVQTLWWKALKPALNYKQ